MQWLLLQTACILKTRLLSDVLARHAHRYTAGAPTSLLTSLSTPSSPLSSTVYLTSLILNPLNWLAEQIVYAPMFLHLSQSPTSSLPTGRYVHGQTRSMLSHDGPKILHGSSSPLVTAAAPVVGQVNDAVEEAIEAVSESEYSDGSGVGRPAGAGPLKKPGSTN